MPRTRKSNENEEASVDLEEDAEAFDVPSEPMKVRVVSSRAARQISFEQWATLRGVKDRHRGGMRAFVSNPDKPRTVSAWDKIFEKY